jgi:peptidyl-prolyl cis-trans isomerase C
MLRVLRYLLCVAAVLSAVAFAESPASEVILATTPKVTLTKTDYEAELERLPADQRSGFALSGKRIGQLLNNMLANRTLAVEAAEHGLDKDAHVRKLIAMQTERILAQARIEEIDAQSAAQFEREIAKHEAQAKEQYLLDRQKYIEPEKVRVSHILIRTDRYSKEEALKLAQELRARALAKEDFAALAEKYSGDPTVKINKGDLGYFAAADAIAPFSQVAFAMKKVGEISEPVLSEFGYHIIRFEGRKPPRQKTFAEVKPQLLADLRDKYVERERQAYLQTIYADPKLVINQAAVDELVLKVDPDTLYKPAPPEKPATGKN